MKKSILAIFAIAALSGNVTLANSPSQDKPASKTTTTVKKTMPSSKAATKTTKTVHKKHVKNS
ncbi:lipoprotein [Spirosoma validum]|uniref:Lipoprotein n=1 Tax=Spirosoma validum TaxID=2771355 RepID=A0A927GF68_9BACT|nr:lipoprotein [Spirosoma validum]MBD2755408.1 lipoprotein [Spirosoma validum]